MTEQGAAVGAGAEVADARLTVYFDGSCPLCSAEIAQYRKAGGAGHLRCIDVSREGADLGAGLTAPAAMARFHVRAADGRLLSGAAAFVELWRRLPGWRLLARLASVPGVPSLLEAMYRGFLPLRPALSRIAVRLGARPENPVSGRGPDR